MHSILAVANLFAYHFHDFDDRHIPAIIEQTIKNRLRYRTVDVHQDQLAWYMGSQEHILSLTKKVHFLSQQMEWDGSESPTWPSGQFFHPSFGKMNIFEQSPIEIEPHLDLPVISPTMPFEVQQPENQHKAQPLQELDPINSVVEDGYMSTSTNQSDDEVTSQDMRTALQHVCALDGIDDHSNQEENKQIEEKSPSIHDQDPRVIIAAIPGTYGELTVQSQTTWDQLLPLWDCKFLPSNEDRLSSPKFVIKAILGKDEGYIGEEEMPPHAFVEQPDRTRMFVIDTEKTWDQITSEHQLSTQQWFDDIGPLYPSTRLADASRISQEQVSTQLFVDLHECMQSFREVNIQCRIPTNTDVLVIHMEGQSEQLVQIASFWHIALSDEWCASHGRKRCFQALSSTSCQFLFPPHGNKWASPAKDLKQFITNRLLRIGISSVSRYLDPSAIKVEFKYHGRVFSPCHLPADMSFEFFIALFQHTTWLNNFGKTPGIVAAGTRIGDVAKVKDLSKQQSCIRCHIVDPLVGGGPSAGSKGQHKQAVNAALAAMLIEEGLQLSQVSEAVKSLVDQMGLPSLTHLLFSESSATREHSFRLMCTTCDIALPPKPAKLAKTQAKFQKIARDEASRNNRNIDVSKYRLIPEYFRMADGTAAPINAAFSPCVSGVTMVNASQASQWIDQKGKLSSDELAIFIVGDISVVDDERLEKFSVPAYNEQGDKVLIGGWLLQLGEKRITTISSDENMVQTLDVKVCSVTLWADDFTTDQWKIAVEQPVKFAKRLLEHDQLHHAIKSPWGRSMRAGKHPAGPQTATSVQFHCEVRIKDLRPLLRRSGFNKVHVLPKDLEGKPDPAWRIIWTDMDITKLETVATPVAGTAGLVKGHKSYGLRVEQAAFKNLWDKLHPGRDPPEQIPKGSLWKATPMPIGLDKEIVQEWAKQFAWECFPIKSLGSKTWLIQSPDPPPKDVMCFNGTPIIIRKVPPRASQPQTGILAGPRSNQTVERDSPSIFRQGDPFLDAWAQWKPTSSHTSSAPPSVSNKADSTVGPTTSRLDLQDKKIQELQQAVEKIQVDSKQKSSDDDRRFTTIETHIARNHEEVQSSFQALRTDFESTLHRAMSAQDNKINTTMDEIKALFLRGSKRPQSGTSPEEDESM